MTSAEIPGKLKLSVVLSKKGRQLIWSMIKIYQKSFNTSHTQYCYWYCRFLGMPSLYLALICVCNFYCLRVFG